MDCIATSPSIPSIKLNALQVHTEKIVNNKPIIPKFINFILKKMPRLLINFS